MKLNTNISEKIKGKIIKSGTWGVASSIIQNFLYSIFFLIVARKYDISEFSSYVISNNLYGLMLAFSAMGLGQWFIRSLIESDNEENIISKFFKIQLILGIIFYMINIIVAIILYKNQSIRILSIIMGVNIIFDNIIYVVKYLNIKNYEQNKTFVINITDAFLKFLLAISVLMIDIPLLILAVLVIIIRFITLNLFIKYGTRNKINFKLITEQKIGIKEISKIIVDNYSFVIIGSISVLFWGLGGIIVSKYLTLNDVGNYEISFKLFSIAEIIPVIISSSIYPILVKLQMDDKLTKLKLYKNAFILFSLYGMMCYTFMLSYGSTIIPYVFGVKYVDAYEVCHNMFLTMVIFPTGVLQANMLISMNKEKIDMKLNVVSLIANILLSVVGIKLIGEIAIVNNSILISFAIFHILQNIYLIKNNAVSTINVISNYFILLSTIGVYYYLNSFFHSNYLFPYFWSITILMYIIIIKFSYKNNQVYKINDYQKIEL